MDAEQKEDSVGVVTSIKRSTLTASGMVGTFIQELVYIGKEKLYGEIVELHDKEAHIQILEVDIPSSGSVGICIGDKVYRTNEFVSIEVGPGLLSNILDGLARPHSYYVSNATATDNGNENNNNTNEKPSINGNGNGNKPNSDTKLWKYESNKELKIGNGINVGDLIGIVYENEIIKEHRILVPPTIVCHKNTKKNNNNNNKNENDKKNKNVKNFFSIVKITPSGEYASNKILLIVKNEETKKEIAIRMSHKRPIRHNIDRLIANDDNNVNNVNNKAKQEFNLFLNDNEPKKKNNRNIINTGYRVLDGILPLHYGNHCAITGPGLGMSVIIQGIMRQCHYQDIIIYIGCSKRSRQMIRMIDAFENCSMISINDFETCNNNRVCFLCGFSNESMGICQASMETGLTIGEYFAQQDRNVIIIIDSISRLFESLMIGLNNKYNNDVFNDCKIGRNQCFNLQSFYQRASMSNITTISVVDGQSYDSAKFMSENIYNIFDVFWCLNIELERKKHFPSIDCFWSFSKNKDENNDDINKYREKVLQLLKMEKKLINKKEKSMKLDVWNEEEKLIIDFCRMLKDDFLIQNVFTEYDYTNPIAKTFGLLKCFMQFYDEATNALTFGQKNDNPDCKSLNAIKFNCCQTMQKLAYLHMEIMPNQEKAKIDKQCDDMIDQIHHAFANLCFRD